MKNAVKVVALLLLLGTAAVFLGGCGDHHDHVVVYDYHVTIINDSPWDVFIEPFGLLIAPGDRMDVDVGYDIVHVIAIRHYDGLILAELDMARGDVLVVE